MSFSKSRFMQLIKRDLIYYKKSNWIGLICIPITIVMIFYLQEITEEHAFSHNFWSSWYYIFLFIGGAIFTSVCMWEFKTPSGRSQYLTIPASNFEKLFSRFLYTLIIYPLFIMIIFWLIAVLGNVYEDSKTMSYFLFSPFKFYVVFHASVFLIALWFNNYSGAKAMLYSVAIFFIVVLFTSILFRIVFSEAFDGFLMFNENIRIEPNKAFQKQVENVYAPILEIIFLWGLPIFLWVVTYFKMKEKEA